MALVGVGEGVPAWVVPLANRASRGQRAPSSALLYGSTVWLYCMDWLGAGVQSYCLSTLGAGVSG